MKLGKMRGGEEGKGREVTFLILLKTLAMVMISLMSESPKKKKKKKDPLTLRSIEVAAMI